ncbi:MAG: ATP-binding cassette domain-containing protein [Clostridia bacterium]|nr:ATP-binding cassette domain-containing protein [Clostridia bacterium]
MDKQNQEVLLKVDHLCQYFRLGRKDLKAVDDVSFEIHKGETFGLVGESGCGKTTTGRSIIKLYDITSGNVYFKGQRIGAGTRSYKDAIKNAKADAKKKLAALNLEKKAADPQRKAEIEAQAAQIKGELAETIAKNKALIRDAKLDHKEVDKQFAASLIKKLDEQYAQKFAEASGDEQKLAALKKEYKNRRRVAKKSKLITQIQMIFQDPIASLDPRMTVRDIIAEGLVINGITDKEYINQRVYEVLETVGLVREHADRYPHEFSGGQRQRIGIARSVVMEPEMIIADEPVSALDVSIQAQVINLLNDLRQSKGLTILFIAHDLSVVKYFSDRIGVMYFGKMVELADSDELFKHPLHPYTKSLLSAIPLPDPVYEKQRVRITYNPIAEHDYTVDQPSFREISPGHFVYCNDAEEAKYKQIISEDAEG